MVLVLLIVVVVAKRKSTKIADQKEVHSSNTQDSDASIKHHVYEDIPVYEKVVVRDNGVYEKTTVFDDGVYEKTIVCDNGVYENLHVYESVKNKTEGQDIYEEVGV